MSNDAVAVQTDSAKGDTMHNPDAIVHALREMLGRDPQLAELLEKSIVQAGTVARAELNPDLY